MSDEQAGGETPGPVPYARFQAVNAKVETYRAEAEAAKAEATAAKAHAEELARTHGAAVESWSSERAILQHGITDPDAVDVVRLLHSRQPADARKPIGEWLSAIREAPDTAPPVLRSLLTPAQTTAAVQGRPAPAANAGATGKNAANAGAVSVEDYRAARSEAMRTNTLAAFVAGPIHQAFVSGKT